MELQLELVRAGAKAPARPSPDTSSNTWLDADGTPAAYGGSDDVSHWLELPGVGFFRFGDGKQVIAFAGNGIADETLEDAFRRIVLPLALQAQGEEVLHASAVAGPVGVVAICAVSGTGKTTVAYGSSLRGHTLWADDAVAFRLEGSNVLARPLPFTVRLKGQSLTRFGEGIVNTVHEPSGDRLGAIVVLERNRQTAVERLDSAAAFPLVLEHAYCFDLEDEERKRAMMASYLELVGRVPVYRASMETGLDQLDSLLDLLESEVFVKP